SGDPRGTTPDQLPHTWAGANHDRKDGFLLTARGNPYENVVRDGDEVIVYTAEGKDIRLKPLKKLVEEKSISQRGLVSMQGVAKHLDRMECYTCHASWAPQCFGCHVKVDFSQKERCPEIDSSRMGFDWIAAGRKHATPEHRTDSGEGEYDLMIPGKISELRSYLRWEEPMMGINGEGRVTPLAPGCQPSVTIIGADGEPILTNHIFKTPGGMERSGEEGQLAIDMSPVQPHTMTKNARTCESCHASDKALGLGIRGPRKWNEKHVVDLETTDGTILPESARTQMGAIENLDHDWSQIVDEQGNQLATVGHHWKLSRAFNEDEITRMSRSGT
ncbi:MAG: cytochrome C, partial [Rubripirellula sp.]